MLSWLRQAKFHRDYYNSKTSYYIKKNIIKGIVRGAKTNCRNLQDLCKNPAQLPQDALCTVYEHNDHNSTYNVLAKIYFWFERIIKIKLSIVAIIK